MNLVWTFLVVFMFPKKNPSGPIFIAAETCSHRMKIAKAIQPRTPWDRTTGFPLLMNVLSVNLNDRKILIAHFPPKSKQRAVASGETRERGDSKRIIFNEVTNNLYGFGWRGANGVARKRVPEEEEGTGSVPIVTADRQDMSKKIKLFSKRLFASKVLLTILARPLSGTKWCRTSFTNYTKVRRMIFETEHLI